MTLIVKDQGDQAMHQQGERLKMIVEIFMGISSMVLHQQEEWNKGLDNNKDNNKSIHQQSLMKNNKYQNLGVDKILILREEILI